MKLGENSGQSYEQLYSSGPAAVTNGLNEAEKDACAFSEVVDKACDELMEKQCKYTIRRINDMDRLLSAIECELDEFLRLRR